MSRVEIVEMATRSAPMDHQYLLNIWPTFVPKSNVSIFVPVKDGRACRLTGRGRLLTTSSMTDSVMIEDNYTQLSDCV